MAKHFKICGELICREMKLFGALLLGKMLEVSLRCDSFAKDFPNVANAIMTKPSPSLRIVSAKYGIRT